MVGFRQEGKVVKIKIKTSALKDMWEQIGKKCEEWAGSVHTWGMRARWIDNVKTEDDVNTQNDDEIFQAKGALIYGFSDESVKKFKKGTLAEIVIIMAKMGVKGDITCKRPDLERRIEAKEHKYTTGHLGMYGGKEARFGIVVEYFSSLMVGITGGVGLMIYDWRNYEHEGEKLQLTRQFLSEEELEMTKKSSMGNRTIWWWLRGGCCIRRP